MATETTPERAMRLPRSPSTHLPPPRPRRRRLVRLSVWGVAAIMIAWAAAVALNATVFHKAVETGKPLTHKVVRGDMKVTLTEEGNVESSGNLDIKCEVAGGTKILWIVKDGTQVKKGDQLVKLDSSAIDEKVGTQQIACEKAGAAQIEAEKSYFAGKIAVQEYLEGTFVKEAQKADSEISVALQNLRSAENVLQHAQRMARKGYITALQRDAQAFALERAKLDLANARTVKHVLVTFTKPKMVEELQSKRDTSQAKMKSEKASSELEQARLKRLLEQVAKCVIHAPRDGMVIYANNEWGRWNQQSKEIEEGATVYERQSIIRLPDLSDMQVDMMVHEAKVNTLRKGMSATVRIQSKTYSGTVLSVANQAQQSSWFSPGVKEYSTIVKIDGRSTDLKPGMTAAVEVQIAQLRDVLSVPVQAVAEQHDKHYCWVNTSSEPARRGVTLGLENTTHVEIKSGLNEGDEVVLNPRKFAGESSGTTRDSKKAKEQPPKAPPRSAPSPSKGSPPATSGAKVESTAQSSPARGKSR